MIYADIDRSQCLDVFDEDIKKIQDVKVRESSHTAIVAFFGCILNLEIGFLFPKVFLDKPDNF